jgi:hypothetical protein
MVLFTRGKIEKQSYLKLATRSRQNEISHSDSDVADIWFGKNISGKMGIAITLCKK